MPSGVYERTPETRRRMSEAKSGENNPNYGDHSPRPYMQGKNHPMFGRRGKDGAKPHARPPKEAIFPHNYV